MLLEWTSVDRFLNQYGLHLGGSFLGIVSILLILGGLLVLLGYWIRMACAVLFCAALPLLFFRLGFWGLAGVQAYVAQTFFMTTAALMGGLVLFMLTGGGDYVIRSREGDWGAAHEFREWGLLLARLLIGGCLFIWDAIWMLFEWEANRQILDVNLIPAPSLVLGCMVVIELVGGAMILFGWRQRVAAWILALYWALTLLAIHRFWSVSATETYTLTQGTLVKTFIEQIYSKDRLLQAKYFLDGLGVIAALLVLTTCISARFGFERKRVSS